MSARNVQIPAELVDRMIELYCDWRTACGEVQAAYDGFLGGVSSDREAAFAAYTAALDREQAACESYAQQVLLIQARYERGPETPIAVKSTSRLRRLMDRLTGVWTQLDYAERRLFEGRTAIPVLSRLRSRATVAELDEFDAVEDSRTSG